MSALEVALLLADPLAEARAAAGAGRRVIGYVGSDVPVELIFAANAQPVRLSGQASAATTLADRFIERAFMPDVRAIAAQWLDGSLNFIDAVVLSRSDDSAQRLYYYICELQRLGQCKGPEPIIYDVAGIERAASYSHTMGATLQLATELGSTISDLPAAARTVATRSALLRNLNAQRAEATPPRGSAIHAVARASGCAWTPGFDAALRSVSFAREAFESRVLLAGNTPPDERIHLSLEARGVTIVGERNDARLFPPDGIDAVPDSIEAIATRHHERRSTAQTWLRSPATLLDAAREARADGVVIWMIEEEETLVWELPAQARTLAAAGIPTLILTRQAWDIGADTLNRIAQFADELKERCRGRS